eukprot:332571-Pleurochrysis_carterae.AAC.2
MMSGAATQGYRASWHVTLQRELAHDHGLVREVEGARERVALVQKGVGARAVGVGRVVLPLRVRARKQQGTRDVLALEKSAHAHAHGRTG